MDRDKRKKLEAKGWKVGNVQEFLGLSPEEIFDVNDVIAYFNYTNRMTHGLGMQPNEYYFGRNRLPDPEAG